MYNKDLAEILEEYTKRKRGFMHRHMFGGIGYLLNGNMCFGVYKEFVILRVGVKRASRELDAPFTKAFDVTGRAMKGWVMVHRDGLTEKSDLRKKLGWAVDFVRMLPPKI